MTSDSQLVQIVDAAVAEAVRQAGDLIACKRGCAHCCIGPFAVTERDLARLRIGFAMAPQEQRSRISARSEEARDAMRDGFPGDWTAVEWRTKAPRTPSICCMTGFPALFWTWKQARARCMSGGRWHAGCMGRRCG